MFKWLQDYFDMSRPQAWSAIILSLGCIVIAGFSYYMPYLEQPKILPIDKTRLAELKQQLIADSNQNNFNKKGISFKKFESDGNNIKPFKFDPNTLDESGWLRLGFSEKSVKTIMNYKNKGGQFYSKADVEKMYSISEAEYKKIESFIQLPEKKAYKPIKFTPYTPVVININTADTAQWNKLRGIGSILSNRIVDYRTKLGGFYSIQQLKEVGIADSLIQQLSPQLKCAPNAIKKINVNTILFQELSQHPYFKNCALSILKFRKINNNNIPNWEMLSTIEGLDPNTLQRIKPYITF